MGQAPHSHTPGRAVGSSDSAIASPTPLSRLESELGGELARFLVGALSTDLRAPREKS